MLRQRCSGELIAKAFSRLASDNLEEKLPGLLDLVIGMPVASKVGPLASILPRALARIPPSRRKMADNRAANCQRGRCLLIR
jgi:hypothetical protein